jgi:hypothetical protein
MQTNNQKSALIEAKSTRSQPVTQVGELRELLTTIERRIAKLKEISAEQALEMLCLLDQASERLDAIDAAGASGSSEATQFESLLMQLEKKDAVFIKQLGGSVVLRQARKENQPDKGNWWWFIDEALAQKRQSKIKYWAIVSAVIAGIWLEHYLLLGPSFHHHAQHVPLGWVEVAVGVGFFGLLAAAVTGYFKQFPELLQARQE